MPLPFYIQALPISIKSISQLILIGILLVCTIGACNPDRSYRLSSEKFVAVLTDIHIAEATVRGMDEKEMGKEIIDSINQAYYAKIFELHEVSETDFVHDYEMLMEQPEQFAQTYEKILEEVSKIPINKPEGQDKRPPESK